MHAHAGVWLVVLRTPYLRTFYVHNIVCIESWSVWAHHASTGHRLSVICYLFLLVLFPLPKLSAEAPLFAIWEGAKNKTAGKHDCLFGRGNGHLPGLLVLLFWPALGLEGQLEEQLFFGAGFNAWPMDRPPL